MRISIAAFLLAFVGNSLTGMAQTAQTKYTDFDQLPHDYWKRPLNDRFTKFKAALEAGTVKLDTSGEQAFLLSFLRALEIPPTSQMLVFSTTSLQLSLISPRNPRAIYFNENVYVGYVPGGKIEVISVDPELGPIFYIFDIPRQEGLVPRIERATRCMNCHAGEEMGWLPGILIKSVVPGTIGGSLEAFRQEITGHAVPLGLRFGGWHVTGTGTFTNHWGNLIGQSSPQGLIKYPIVPGRQFNFARYPVATSDFLAHLLHEHQAGFVNRAVDATYKTRSYLDTGKGMLSPVHAAELDKQARSFTRYLMFADEVSLPTGGVIGDAALKVDFQKGRRMARTGISLKDFDLRTRIFQNRCSYMIYCAAFQGLPPAMKGLVYKRLGEALSTINPDKEYAYLPASEKTAIRQILRETLSDLPKGW
ncbi:MAG: hypothetical protein EXS24_06020 [Pedosphaera sp.]|nr:hypothetical protein [Pedosphaera sp.]